ncbi:MAG: 2,3-bisphosphoglycerate-independent phosphoglycerate mutase [Pseudomonadota bacterium]
MNSHSPKPVVLIILDGFGYREDPGSNAIALAKTPVWNALWDNHPHTLLQCSGEAVGLPDDQMGNSEVGHMHLGGGQRIYQDLTLIGKTIRDGSFFENPVLLEALEQSRGRRLHILTLLSTGGVHSDQTHSHALVRMAEAHGVSEICLHAFLDGRDTPPRSAAEFIAQAEAAIKPVTGARIASLTGRFYAMDRDNRWDRVEKAYRMLVGGQAEQYATSALEGLEMAYARGESDEFVLPTAIVPPGTEPVTICDGDGVVFMNFRADRARELCQALTRPDFTGFERGITVRPGCFVTLTRYHQNFDYPVVFPPREIRACLGETLAKHGLTQLRLAETEKYAHVTFFFNGGIEQPYPGEERVLVPSPNVTTYDLKPDMSATEVTDALVNAIVNQTHDVIVCNYANCDMVGHTGVLSAAIEAVEAVDASLGRVLAALDRVDGALLLTADHGNIEQMTDPVTGEAHTAHTMNRVPLVYRGKRPVSLMRPGDLADVAPTLLDLLDIEKPVEMTGRSLFDS